MVYDDDYDSMLNDDDANLSDLAMFHDGFSSIMLDFTSYLSFDDYPAAFNYYFAINFIAITAAIAVRKDHCSFKFNR